MGLSIGMMRGVIEVLIGWVGRNRVRNVEEERLRWGVRMNAQINGRGTLRPLSFRSKHKREKLHIRLSRLAFTSPPPTLTRFFSKLELIFRSHFDG